MNSGALFWSVRRELWENRSIYLAPLIVAGVIALASVGAVRHNLQPANLASHDELVRQGDRYARLWASWQAGLSGV